MNKPYSPLLLVILLSFCLCKNGYGQNIGSESPALSSDSQSLSSETTKINIQHIAAKSQQPLDEINIFELRAQGDRAFADKLYDVAEKFYLSYWKGAFDQDVLVDAAIRLVKSKIPQQKIGEALNILQQIPTDIQAFLSHSPAPQNSHLTEGNASLIKYWTAKVILIQGDAKTALDLFADIALHYKNTAIGIQAALGMSNCYLSMRDWATAETILKEIIPKLTGKEDLNNAIQGLIQIAIATSRYNEADLIIDQHWDAAQNEFQISLGMLRITSFLQQKKIVEAHDFYQTTFAQNDTILEYPGSYPIMRSLGLSLLNAKRFPLAISIFEKLLRLADTETHKKEIMMDLAECADFAGEIDLAIKYYTNYLDLYRNDNLVSKIQLRVAELFEVNQNPDKALEFYSLVYDKDSNWPPYRYRAAQNMAWLYRKVKQDYEKAIKYFYSSSTLDVKEEEKARGVYFAAETYLIIEGYNNAAIYFQTVADTYTNSSFSEQARFRQAQSRLKGKRTRLAAEAFSMYLKEWPDGQYSEESLLMKGIAERLAGDYTLAITTLRKFSEAYPESSNTPRALLEASQAAAAADLQSDALIFLSKIVEKYPDADIMHLALYRRAYMLLSYGYADEGTKVGYDFLARYSDAHPILAADVYMWLADHFANLNNFVKAEELFMAVVQDYPTSIDAPMALYEAAKVSYNSSRMGNGDYQSALNYLDRLLATYPKAPDRILAQSQFLRGDIESSKGMFDQALKSYQDCITLVPKSDLSYAAIGRIGECYYSLAELKDSPSDYYQTALSYFNTVIADLDQNHAFVDMARYRVAKIYELLNQSDKAKDEYSFIFYKNDYQILNNRILDWYYFARSGFDLARFYTDSGDYSSARKVYKRLAEFNTPISDDARLRVEEIDKIYTQIN